MVTEPLGILAILLAVLGTLFAMSRHPRWGRVFKYIPLLVFAYFLPTLLSNTGVIPLKSSLYDFIKHALLPASLILLTLSVDVKGILKLGRPALLSFLVGTASIVIGGPIAYLLLGWLVPDSLGDQAWKGLAALAGSWIGGGANFVAIGESVGANDATLGMMIVVDVAVASAWMAVLLWFAGRDEKLDASSGADRTALDDVRKKVADFQAKIARPTNLADLLLIAGISLGGTALATSVAAQLPEVGDVVGTFTWKVIIATTIGLGLSFTKLRRLEGAGASAVGSVFLYLLVASIGAKAEFLRVIDAPALVAVGAVWMLVHAGAILAVWRIARVPIFFPAVGSQANVGGAASAPIVAAAFHPALAPVGILLAVGGYVLGTYAALVCAFLLQWVHQLTG